MSGRDTILGILGIIWFAGPIWILIALTVQQAIVTTQEYRQLVKENRENREKGIK